MKDQIARIQIDWYEFQIALPRQPVARLLVHGYNPTNFDCLAPRPECGAGASAVDLGEGAKRDAPLFLNMSDAEGSKSDHLEIWIGTGLGLPWS